MLLEVPPRPGLISSGSPMNPPDLIWLSHESSLRCLNLFGESVPVHLMPLHEQSAKPLGIWSDSSFVTHIPPSTGKNLGHVAIVVSDKYIAFIAHNVVNSKAGFFFLNEIRLC
ncbi:hypothetical protein AAHE18_13G039400 [Arachis hypogaea]